VTQPALVVMAAGIGSRYGGLKQVDPIGPGGEIVIDYAVYDALRAGFEQVIFVIRREIEDVFREKIGGKIEKRVETAYVFQELDDLPPGFQLPENRKKPWGTGHAVLSCRDVIDRPFAVINADDFYGFQAFQDLANYLHHASDQNGVYDFAMVGYALSNTLSEHGSVARGVCQVSVSGYLEGIQERTRIEPREGQIMYTENGADWTPLSADSIVSMNMWGFTPSMITELAARFPIFLQKNAANIEKAEYFLPSVVNDLLQEGKARVRVLPVKEKWYGVTYPQDRPAVQEAVRELVRRGLYPENLWS
jgi:hypothetical protein